MSRHVIPNNDPLIRCDACDFLNDPAVRSSDHEFIPAFEDATSRVDGIGNTILSKYEIDTGGCARCGCPIWNSGGRITWGKRRRG